MTRPPQHPSVSEGRQRERLAGHNRHRNPWQKERGPGIPYLSAYVGDVVLNSTVLLWFYDDDDDDDDDDGGGDGDGDGDGDDDDDDDDGEKTSN